VTFILDACALIAFLNDDEEADVVENLFDQAVSHSLRVLVSWSNTAPIFTTAHPEAV
jgi:uncharacterized protein with PIN domain